MAATHRLHTRGALLRLLVLRLPRRRTLLRGLQLLLQPLALGLQLGHPVLGLRRATGERGKR